MPFVLPLLTVVLANACVGLGLALGARFASFLGWL